MAVRQYGLERNEGITAAGLYGTLTRFPFNGGRRGAPTVSRGAKVSIRAEAAKRRARAYGYFGYNSYYNSDSHYGPDSSCNSAALPPEKWHALPLLWEALPLLWHAVPLFGRPDRGNRRRKTVKPKKH